MATAVSAAQASMAEIERLRELLEDTASPALTNALVAREIRAAVAAEREACAQIAERLGRENNVDEFTSRMIANECKAIAAAIRARGDKP